jgi:lipopolysaccharide transport system permease protein
MGFPGRRGAFQATENLMAPALQGFYEFFCLHRKNLLYTLVARNLKVKYRGSVLGFFWTLLIPICQVAVFYFIYKVVLKIETPNYLAFIVSGIIPWLFFSTTVLESMESLVSAQNLLTQAPIPIQAFPASSVSTNFMNMIYSLPVLIAVILAAGISLKWVSLLALPMLIVLFLFTYSLAFILACWFVIFRDLRHVFGILIQLWIYLTPVFYAAHMVPERYRWILFLNPLSGFFVGFRNVLIDGVVPDVAIFNSFILWTIALFFLANLIRVKLGPKLVERV